MNRPKILLGILIGVALATSLAAQTVIRTVAGGGPNNGRALSVPLPSIYHVTVDSAGNVYISVTGYRRIYKLTTSGILVAVAGAAGSSPDFYGDGGLAVEANVYTPSGLAVDDSRQCLYFSDQSHNRVRKVDLRTGIITTYAGGGFGPDGGPANQAHLWIPSGLALDSAGNLYIADTNDNLVRRVDVVTGIITTVAGNGGGGSTGDGGLATAAEVGDPEELAIDAWDTLYISDKANRRVRKVTGGRIYAFAGTGISGNTGDGGPATAATLAQPAGLAVDSTGVYIADHFYNRVRKVSFSDGIIRNYAGLANGVAGFGGDGLPADFAKLWSPWGLAINPATHSLVIADYANIRVRNVDANGVISTIAGNGDDDWETWGDGGPATDASCEYVYATALCPGNECLFIADSNGYIRKLDFATGMIDRYSVYLVGYDRPGEEHRFTSSLNGLAVDAARNLLYVSDYDGHAVFRVDLNTRLASYFMGSSSSANDGDGPALNVWLHGSRRIAVDSRNGDVYIADEGGNRIRRVTLGSPNMVTTVAGTGVYGFTGDGGPGINARLAAPAAVAVDTVNNLLYIGDTSNQRVRVLNLGTGTISPFAGEGHANFAGDGGLAELASFRGPKGLAVDGTGNVWIADTGNHRIRVVSRATRFISTFAGSGEIGNYGNFAGEGVDPTMALLNYPNLVTLGPDGSYWISDTYNFRVRKVTVPAGEFPLSLSVTPAGSGSITASPAIGDGYYPCGTRVCLTAAPSSAAFRFARWTGDASDAANCLVVDGYKTVTATFDPVPTFTISPSSANFNASGGTGSVSVTSSIAGALWTATSDSVWITITSGASGAGNGSVGYTVAGNPGAARTGTLTIAGKTFKVSQAASNCSFALSSLSASVGSGAGTTASLTGSFRITPSACLAANTWTAVSDSPRLAITSAGTGNGAAAATVSWSMYTNSTTQARTAHITVAGQTYTVTQAGTSENQSQRVVRALYQTILGREPDPGGWAFWTGPGAPTNPTTGAVLYNQMADGFYSSAEFKNSGWLVLNLYQIVTGRLPDFDSWSSAVARIRNGTITPAQLTDTLAGSMENGAFVQAIYQNGCGRAPNSTELITDVANLIAGQSKFDLVSHEVLTESDFTERTNGMLVQALYYTILVRDVDQGGFNFWQSQLDPPNGQAGIYYLYNPQPPTPQYGFKLAVIGQAVPPNPNLLGFLGSPEFQRLIQ